MNDVAMKASESVNSYVCDSVHRDLHSNAQQKRVNKNVLRYREMNGQRVPEMRGRSCGFARGGQNENLFAASNDEVGRLPRERRAAVTASARKHSGVTSRKRATAAKNGTIRN